MGEQVGNDKGPGDQETSNEVPEDKDGGDAGMGDQETKDRGPDDHGTDYVGLEEEEAGNKRPLTLVSSLTHKPRYTHITVHQSPPLQVLWVI